ncbi:UNVERIFIED_CONTAM: hypothetical protein FKN15_018302, partial [Acipenser sinensis]
LILCFSGVHFGQRVVETQRGPLFRAQGSHVTLSCKVRGYEGTPKQNFHWSIYRPASPSVEIHIVSTADPHFTYALYRHRVRMQDIYIERTSTDSVLLHITKLQMHDQGEYECYTPNTDSVYYGAYSDKTILTVIPDTLQARISALSIRRAAGESLSLSCDVSKRTSQHTHLSISWFLQTGGETLEIVTLTREFILQAGTAFHHRLESGHLRLDRSGLTTYLLTIFQLQHSDQGEIYCEATEWIQDPDESWYPLLIKRTESTKVTVEQRPPTADVRESVIPDTLQARISALSIRRAAGESLSLSCDVLKRTSQHTHLSISWFLQTGGETLEIVTLTREFILQAGTAFHHRLESGHLRLDRSGLTTYLLTIFQLQHSDQGEIYCEATEWIQDPDESWYPLLIKRTESTKVTVEQRPPTADVRESEYTTDSSVPEKTFQPLRAHVISDSLKVAAPQSRSKTGNITEGSSFDLRCTASQDSVEGTRLSVTWEVRRGAASEKILSLNPDGGVMAGSDYSQRYQVGGVRLELLGNGVYRLVVSQALPTDEGTYVCVAGQWVKDESGAWKNILEKSMDVGEVKVTPIAPSLMVSVGEGNVTLNADSTLELTCTVATANRDAIRMEVTWYVSPTPSADQGSSRLLVHMDRDSVVNGSGAVTVSRVSADATRLVFREVEKTDTGYYFCKVVGWMPQCGGTWYKAAEKTSTSVRVTVTSLEPTFSVLLSAPTTPHFSDDQTELECKVTDVQNANGTRMTVSWHYRKPTPADLPVSDDLIATMDQNWDLQAGEKYKERVGKGHIVLTKLDPAVFKLQVLHTRDTDRGEYFCTVSAWAQTKDHSWVKTKDVSSRNLPVSWEQEDPSLTVVATPLKAVFSGGDTFEMACKVTGKKLKNPKYSVLINVEEPSSRKIRKIMSMTQDSVTRLEEWNEKNRLDSVVLEKSSVDEFRFRMYGTQISDAGYYYCEVTAWTPDAGNTWSEATRGISNKVKIDFENTGPAFNVSLHSDKLTVYTGETVKIECVITVHGAAAGTDDISYDVKWSVSTEDKSVFLVSMDRWGVMTLAPRNGTSDCSLERIKPRTYRLSIHNTEDTDCGSYHCSVTPWLKTSDGAWQKSLEIQSEPVHLKVDFAMLESLKYPLLFGAAAALCVGLLAMLIGYIGARFCYYSASQRTVQIQQGRLYRAKGYPVTVSCNVSGYETNTKQEFEFSFFSPDNPQQEINIISTKDTNFAYAKYGGRVRQKDIFIDRRSKDSVLLHIRKLENADTGEYECHTPNTDSKYFGTYNDKMNLTVIEDTLDATLGKETLNKFEGDPLQLKCEVSKQTLQHTHISVTWYLNKTEDLRVPIISLMRGFVLNPGSEYRVRYEAGHIGLDKIGGTTYRLSISQLQQSDQGQIYCEAGEWIQDPDRSWYQIASKTTAATTVNVQSVASNLSVVVSSNTVNITEGHSLHFDCKVTGSQGHLSVTWRLSEGHDIITLNQIGVLQPGSSYRERIRSGDIRVDRVSQELFTLEISSSLASDQGTYMCVVTEWTIEANDKWKQEESKFHEVAVTITLLRSLLTAELKSRTINVKDNESIILQCKVKGPKVPLTITWTFMAKGSQTENIVVLHYDGKITWGEKTSNFKFKTIVEKTESVSNLKITRTSSTEMGKYQCVAEVWINEVQLANVSSNELEVIVSKPVSKLSISSEPLTIKSKVNANVEIECKITASTYEDSQFEVSWYTSKYDEELSNKIILKNDRNNILMPGELMNSHEMKNKYQSKRCSRSSYKLSILQTDLTDSGKYYCVVEEWLQDANNIWYSLDKKSVEIEVNIASIEKKLHVHKSDVSISLVEKQGSFKLKCSIDSISSRESTFEVTWWKRTEQGENQAIFIAQRNSTLSFLNGTKSILLFERPTAKLYTLTVQRAVVTDSGRYYCRVKELLLSPRNQWHEIAADTSGTSTVDIKQEVLDKNSAPECFHLYYLPVSLCQLSGLGTSYRIAIADNGNNIVIPKGFNLQWT